MFSPRAVPDQCAVVRRAAYRDRLDDPASIKVSRPPLPTLRRPNHNHELPMMMPAMNTNTPPTTTWNAADSHGVSMKRWRM